MHCHRCDATTSLVAIFGADKRRPARYVCQACQAKARACVECGATASIMFEIRCSHPTFAKIEEERIAKGEIDPRRICPDCLRRLRTEVDEETGRPRIVDKPAPDPSSSSSTSSVFSKTSPKTKPPRRSSAGGVFSKVKS